MFNLQKFRSLAKPALIIGLLFLASCTKTHVDSTLFASPELKQGQLIASKHCFVCHTQGLRGAPRVGNIKEWQHRIAQGEANLLQNSIDGYNKMPARGGNPNLSDEEILFAIRYMVLVSSNK